MLEPERRQRWFEVCIVLVVTCGILIVNAVYLSANGQGSAPRVSGQHRAEGLGAARIFSRNLGPAGSGGVVFSSRTITWTI